MYLTLSPGALGMKPGSLRDALMLAMESGYQGLEVSIHEVAELLDQHGADFVRGLFRDANIRPAGFGLPVPWNGPEEEWRQGLEKLAVYAKAAQQIGCLRTMTWVLSGSNERPYEENRQFHIQRFRPIAEILEAHGCRLGLEFLGPKTIRDRLRYPFIYRMEDMLELAHEIGPNVGLLLDSWHWYTSGGTVENLRALRNEDVVYVHVNDAPRGVPLEEHVDNRRTLPGATGVIDLCGFLQALHAIGYDGPVVCEPFGNPAVWAADVTRSAFERAGVPLGS